MVVGMMLMTRPLPPELTTQPVSDFCVNSEHMTADWRQISVARKQKELREKDEEARVLDAATAARQQGWRSRCFWCERPFRGQRIQKHVSSCILELCGMQRQMFEK